MGRRFLCATVAVVLLGVWDLAAQSTAAPEVGRLVYLEGSVAITRDGVRLEAGDLAAGEPIYQFDVLQTGPDGYAEVEITAAAATVMRVRENTTCYIEVETGAATDGSPPDRGETRTNVRLFGGRTSFSVDGLGPSERLRVATESAVLGVRGTEFDVIVAPDEATLLGVREGSVALERSEDALPVSAGEAAEATGSGSVRINEIGTGGLESYYAEWEALRLELFRSGAATFIVAYARRYRETLPVFQEAYRELMEHSDELRRAAEREDSSLGEDMRLRTAVSPALIRMRSILPLFETTLYRLRELQRFHAQGIGRTSIGDTPSTRFFAEFNRRAPTLALQLSRVRTALILYNSVEQRSFGGLPSGPGMFDIERPQPGSLFPSNGAR